VGRYHVIHALRSTSGRATHSFKQARYFDATPDPLQSRLSPVTHVARGKNIPRFLIPHVADPPLTTTQSQRLAAALQEAGVPAKAHAAAETNHTKLNSDLGLPTTRRQKKVFELLSRAVNDTAD
jgi:acetyl esterase/lipase